MPQVQEEAALQVIVFFSNAAEVTEENSTELWDAFFLDAVSNKSDSRF